MHVLLLAGHRSDALSLADAWTRAAPHTTVEVHEVSLPAVPAAPGPGAAPSGGRGVLVAGAALPVGRPTAERSSAPSLTPSSLGRAEAAALAERAAHADLVMVYVPVLDGPSLHRGPVVEAALAASTSAVPVVVLAGRSEASRREWSTAGLSGVHEVGDDPGARLVRVARTWAPAWT
ncbi:hypothetical protein [Antribacter gilvus]|uniref:hypothetical protein n=1 Tax=Antribacter gilvus TaxID=2304675 RepID=UPI000F79047C|nr:hypothetical protein [Antribacter gilvus]